MNNGEWLQGLPEEGLAGFLASNVTRCDMCASQDNEHACSEGMEECARGILEWLKTEHEKPDTWERIEEDARSRLSDYWGCADAICQKCPALIDGMKPHEYFDVDHCSIAKNLDLVRRCRELAERERGL